MQDICTTIDEIDINLKPGQRNVNVGNKNLKLVKRSSSTTAKKMILLGRATKNTNKRENEKRSQSLIKKCKDNKFRCVRAILTIAREKGKVQAKLGKEIKFKDNRKNLQMKLHRWQS